MIPWSIRDHSDAHDARVVDQHGDRAEGVLGGGHRGRPVPVARDVEAGEDRLTAELVGERPSLLLEYVSDHNVRALSDEAARVAGAHSTGTARNNHCPIIETFHDPSPFITGRSTGASPASQRTKKRITSR